MIRIISNISVDDKIWLAETAQAMNISQTGLIRHIIREYRLSKLRLHNNYHDYLRCCEGNI